ncbi:hypothetical protein ACE1TI_11380 [Alteribacillus sp. JSM 102045]|uniref:hypothetical protein n=1 Tax=Alteribacillus sp. JSM 102045 TaxID=1562101 RepID=UPI0035C19546
MKNFQLLLHNEGAPLQPLSLQTFLNDILKELAYGHISTRKELLLTIKHNWKYISNRDFNSVSEKITSLAAMMDECLKMFTAFTHSSEWEEFETENHIVICRHINNTKNEAWVLLTGDKEEKNKRWGKTVHMMNKKFPNADWILKGLDAARGERFLMQKKRI